MSRLLFVTPERPDDAIGGREQLSALHRAALADLLGDDFRAMALPQRKASGLRAKWTSLGGQIDGADRAALDSIIGAIDQDAVDTVWLDGTNLGWIAARIARSRPSVRIISFAHNVESAFFDEAFRQRPTLRSWAVRVANRRAERMAVKASHTLIALNDRDGAGFARRFGRRPDGLLPIALAEPAGSADAAVPDRPYLLFVGGSFYANRQGIRWFAREVAPSLAIETLVVGRGMEDLRGELEHAGKVRVVGQVDALEPWYRGAAAVVAPIFSGSGMKTKVAEAWMFGKRVIGTPEAFVGYDLPPGCPVCETAGEFVTAINDILARADDQGAALRALFDQHHSVSALSRGMKAILAGRP